MAKTVNTHLVVAKSIWHSKEKTYYEPGEKVNLDHIDPLDIEVIENKGTVVPLKNGKTDLAPIVGDDEDRLLKAGVFDKAALLDADPRQVARAGDVSSVEVRAWKEKAAGKSKPPATPKGGSDG